ncbi:hypothetical protein YTPLAS18_19720 [Nitrospira sp.]|nr:hypothetical protein YTPLAS18_19720 [Nitrospira sp.]
MAVRDDEWPGYTQWYCCSLCHRLWAFQGSEMVVLDTRFSLAPARTSPGVPGRPCLVCTGNEAKRITSI